MRGRVFGTITASVWAAMPLGTLLGGVATEQFGVQAMLILIGAIYVLTTLSMAFIPAMRQMDRRKTNLTFDSAVIASVDSD